MDLGYAPFDGDNHYYEALDAFTRHLDPKLGPRIIQWATINGRSYHVIGGRVSRAVTNPTFDPVSPAGALSEYFRGNPDGKSPLELLGRPEPIRPAYRDRDARLRVMDEQGLAKVWLFPTLGMIYEELIHHDPQGAALMFSAFNRWLEEDWGFAYEDRIITAPMLSLADPAAALIELDRLIERGARIVHVRPAPVPGEHGSSRSLGDRVHDPVWARMAEASIPVAFHLGDSGYNAFTVMWGGSADFEGFGRVNILSKILVSDRAIHDTIASMVVDGVFYRHPTLRAVSVENGSDWMPVLVKRLKKQANQTPWAFKEDPLEVIRRNVWVTPYYEEDIDALAELIGVERVLFGSDWPHGEGLAEPTDFVKELHNFDEAGVRRIMRDNALELLG
jgi:predicted TIM-barrel fold metal-dependent hydrolase